MVEDRGKFRASRGVVVLCVEFAGVATAFATQILTARLIGDEQYGLHAVAISFSAVLLLPAVLGMDTVVLRNASEYFHKGLHGENVNLVRFARRFVLAASGIVLALACVAALMALSVDLATATAAYGVLLASAAVPFAAQLAISLVALRARHCQVLASALSSVARPLMMICFLLVAAAAATEKVDATSSITAYVGSFIVVAGLSLLLLRRLTGSESVSYRLRPELRRNLIRSARAVFLGTGSETLMGKADILVVGLAVNLTDAGHYAAAARLTNLVLLGLAATNAMVSPRIAAVHATGDQMNMQEILRQSAILLLSLTLPLVLGLVVGGGYALRLFGEGFIDAYPVLAILTLAQVANALCGPVGYFLLMTGHERAARQIMVRCALFGLLAFAGLTMLFGIIGAAVASALTTILRNLWMLYSARSLEHVDPSVCCLLRRNINGFSEPSDD